MKISLNVVLEKIGYPADKGTTRSIIAVGKR